MRAWIQCVLTVASVTVGQAAAQEVDPPAPAPAEAPAPPWRAGQEFVEAITVGFRGAWAKPLGSFAGLNNSPATRRFQEEFVQAFPFTVELGYRAAQRFTFGAYFSYGVAKQRGDALVGGCAEPPLSCERGRTMRLGAQLLYRFSEWGAVSTWAGAGFGYEWTGFDVRDQASKATVSYEGRELLNLQLGGDYRPARRLYVGPYAAFTFAQFRNLGIKGDRAVTTLDFSEPRIHSWLMLGLRGGFEL